MASGFKSVHPLVEQALREIGIEDGDVSQGWGYAQASAGYHEPEGTAGGRRYSSCVDLTGRLGWSTDLRARLLTAGLVPFYRDWEGNEHTHCVAVGLRNDAGKITIRRGPREQIDDYLAGRDGTTAHAALTGTRAATRAERVRLAEEVDCWSPRIRVMVLDLNGRAIPGAYGFLEGERTVCLVRPLVEALGWTILSSSGAEVTLQRAGKQVTLSGQGAGLYLAGNRLRGVVAALAAALGCVVDYRDDGGYRGVCRIHNDR